MFVYLSTQPSRAALPLLAALLLTGCGSDPLVNTPASQISSGASQPVDDLTLAMDALALLPNSPDDENAQRALYYLNKWGRQQEDVATEYKIDPLVENLPRVYREPSPLHPGLASALERRNYSLEDLYYLQQSVWLRDVAKRIAVRKPNADFVPWYEELEKTAGITAVQQLAKAERLFDWTISNIQLDPLPPPPKAPVASAKTDNPASILPSLPGPMRGDPGPGYSQLPWQTLLYGHGDVWERSRIFILLTRQVGVPVVMLGVPDEQGSGVLQPWTCAVLLGDQLYLFDAGLGLPIPGPEGKGIATLEQAIAQPELLRKLDLEGGSTYPIGAAQLKNIVAMLDADPDALSARFQLLEAALQGENQVAVTTKPSLLEPALRKCKPLSSVTLWRVPVEAWMFTHSRQYVLAMPQNAQKREEFIESMFIFLPPHPMLTARYMHLQGKFDEEDESKPGARQRYLKLRPPDSQIEALEDTAPAIPPTAQPGAQLSKEEQQKQKRVKQQVEIARRLKDNATYWIGLSHLDSGNASVAQEWLQQRTLEGTTNSAWKSGARYNLGRCYEALGKWQQARDTYLADDSPQRHGNLLRVRWIETQHLQSPPPAAETSTKPGDASKPE